MNKLIIAPLLAAATAAAQQPVAAKSGATLIKNATVMTVTKGTLQNTDLLLQNGKIAAIGRNLTAPAGAQVIDATGKYVMPGIIDPHSHSMSDAVNEGSLSVTSMVRIRDVLNPTDPNIYRQLAGGRIRRTRTSIASWRAVSRRSTCCTDRRTRSAGRTPW